MSVSFLRSPSSAVRRGRTIVLLAVLLCLALLYAAGAVFAGEYGPIRAALLTRDLGDPRAPGNAKLVLALPDALSPYLSTVTADDFQVYVYPEQLSDDEGTVERFRAGGIYLWRFRHKIFLDVRELPLQDGPGLVKTRIVYAPRGVPVAHGFADGVSRYTTDAVDVALAVDVSSSMLYTDPLKRRVAAARTFIEMAREGGGVGRVALVTFNHNAQVNTPLVPLTQGDRLLSDLTKIGANGQTNLDLPIDLSLKLFADSKAERPVIVLLTDGKNEGSKYANTHKQCVEAGVRIFAVGLSEHADHQLLEQMAEDTGGIYFRAPADSDLPEIYARLAAELGKRYLLHAEILRDEYGEVVLPVDRTVRRVVSMTDGGARLYLTGPDGREVIAGSSAGKLGSVFVGRPAPGDWTFAWDDATPDVSALALFGDTQFFLDVFPPQLQGETFAVGATLAMGGTPLTGARVWLESVPGAFADRVELFDDGAHGDGLAGDGVYGAVIGIGTRSDRFDVTVRATGEAWDQGRFVRQTAGLVIRSAEDKEPPKRGPSLDGDIDFGILYPGETGAATITTELNAPEPGDFLFELAWPDHDARMPRLDSEVTIEPGEQSFEIEITVPETAAPGAYRGVFSIYDDYGLTDAKEARVTVGSVVFADPGIVDLGLVPPGTTAFRRVAVNVRAAKAVGLRFGFAGDPGLKVEADRSALADGDNQIVLAISASSPIGTPNQERAGMITLQAGPGAISIPVIWEIRAFEPGVVPGLERPGDVLPSPDMLVEPAPLDVTFDDGQDGWLSDTDRKTRRNLMDESPWDKTRQALDQARGDTDQPALVIPPSTPAYTTPAAYRGDGEESFWSAWWVYILAALILLILLLLLLSYILYRLGSSSMVRFLLASLILNLILLAIFVALLGNSGSVEFDPRDMIEVTLTEVGEGERVSMLSGDSGLPSDGLGGGASEPSAAASELGMSSAPSGGSSLPAERRNDTVTGPTAAAELNQTTELAMVSLETGGDDLLSRRDRTSPRTRRDAPMPELPEISDPFGQRDRSESEHRESVADSADSGERVDVTADMIPETPAWSGDERTREASSGWKTPQLVENPTVEMEIVEQDVPNQAAEPRSRRRRAEAATTLEPEPRVEIDDPRRDENAELQLPVGTPSEEDPGMEETRLDDITGGRELAASRPRSAAGQPERLTMDQGGSARPVGFAAERRTTDIPGRRERQPGRRAGGDENEQVPLNAASGLPGGVAPSGVTANSGTGGTLGAEAVGETRFDGGAASSAGTDGLLTALRNGGGDSSRTGMAASRLGEPGSGMNGNDRSEFNRDGTGGSGLVREAGPNGGAQSRRSTGPGGSDEVGGDNPASGRDNVPGSYGTTPGASSATGDNPGQPGRQGAGTGQGQTGQGPAESRADGFGPGGRLGNGEGRSDGRRDAASGAGNRPDLAGTMRLPSSSLGGVVGDTLPTGPESRLDSDWSRNSRKTTRRGMIEAASAVEADSLLIVVGDFSRLPDSASENLFAALDARRSSRVTIEERSLRPGEPTLGDCLLALVTPEETADWSDEAFASVGRYLRDGGHLWVDATREADAERLMAKLASVVNGEQIPLPRDHQLSEGGAVRGLFVGENLAAVATAWDWRQEWRYAERQNGALRFLARTLNYFLSGNAEQGIEIDDIQGESGVLIAGGGDHIPDVVRAPAVEQRERVWQSFRSGSEEDWRVAPWGDRLAVSTVSDGKGAEALKLDFEAAEKGRMAFYRTLNPPENLQNAATVEVNMYYTGAGNATVSLILTTLADGQWRDSESPPVALREGWNRLSFPVRNGMYRPLADAARGYAAGLPGVDRVARTGFIVNRRADAPGMALIGTISVHEE